MVPEEEITYENSSWSEKRAFVVQNNLVQKPNYNCRRVEENNEYEGDFFQLRNSFSIDRDRIKFSRAFRRLQHKAQIYTHEKGDHYRTRLTHTLEVLQIARSIARNLNLNEDLVEAIALGHDIGHTPFGHQGERTLDKIMCGEHTLGGRIRYKINYGGFKHNFHSLKILDVLGIKFKHIKGKNLTWQVMEGIVKHTKIRKSDRTWELSRFVQDENILKGYMRYDNSVTLEGQVVAIADEIAQREHDIDDGLRDSNLKLGYESVAGKILDKIEELLEKWNDNNSDVIAIESVRALQRLKTNIVENLENSNGGEDEHEKNLQRIKELTEDVINFFITDVTTNSMRNIIEKGISYKVEEGHKVYFTEKLIDFSSYGNEIDNVIEDYINNKILNAYDVNRFDGKAVYIIRQIFKAYYTNPRQMPTYILQRLQRNVKNICENIYKVKIKYYDEKGNCFKEKYIDEIDLINDKSTVDYYIKLMKLNLDIEKLCAPYDISETKEEFYGSLAEENIKEDKFKYAIKEIHYAYLSVICDYIAGMTDNYANDEFKNLYLTE